jgi:flagellar operon protein
MSDRMKVGHMFPAPAAPLGMKKPPSASARNEQPGQFQKLLKANTLVFSHHAEMRMKQRGITLNPEQLSQIAGAIEQAEAKGAKDSLVLYRDIAMIVNVPSKTVVTAMEGKAFQGNVFTQIDSAVIIN